MCVHVIQIYFNPPPLPPHTPHSHTHTTTPQDSKLTQFERELSQIRSQHKQQMEKLTFDLSEERRKTEAIETEREQVAHPHTSHILTHAHTHTQSPHSVLPAHHSVKQSSKFNYLAFKRLLRDSWVRSPLNWRKQGQNWNKLRG